MEDRRFITPFVQSLTLVSVAALVGWHCIHRLEGGVCFVRWRGIATSFVSCTGWSLYFHLHHVTLSLFSKDLVNKHGWETQKHPPFVQFVNIS